MTESEREKKIMDNHNLIYKFINDKHLDTEEYYGILAIGLIKAVDTFDESKGAAFSTYAYTCMRNEYIEELKRKKRDSLSYAISTNSNMGDEGTELQELITGEENVDISYSFLTEKISKQPNLTKKERQIANYLIAGLSKMEIAEKMGVSKQYIYSTIKGMQHKFRRDMNGSN